MAGKLIVYRPVGQLPDLGRVSFRRAGEQPSLPGSNLPPIKNRIIQGVGNGVFAIINDVSVVKHTHKNSFSIEERSLTDAEVGDELKKIEHIRERYGTPKSEDDQIFPVVVQQLLDEAAQQVSARKINADAVIFSISQRELTEHRETASRLTTNIQTSKERIGQLSLELQHETDEAAREAKIAEMDREDGMIGGYRTHLTRMEAFLSDYHALIERIIIHLKSHHETETADADLHLGEKLSWPDIQDLFARGAKGFILDGKWIGPVNHPFIFSHEAGIPVVTIDDPLSRIGTADRLSIDSRTGQVIINPSPTTVQELERRKRMYHEMEKMFKARSAATHTLDGRPLPELQVNIKDREDFAQIKGREVGLFRTEGMYQKSAMQVQVLVRVFKELIGRSNSVNIRLFDIDHDKIPEFFTPDDIAEFKASRGGIDFLLKSTTGRGILIYQLKALLIAFDRLQHGGKTAMAAKTVRLILPMVTNPNEVRAVKKLMTDVEADLIERRQLKGEVARNIKVGVMIETASAVVNAELLADEADYFSIGGNDLTKDLLGFSDRRLMMTGKDYDWLSPAVLLNIKRTIEVAKAKGIPVTCCGEISRDPLGAILMFLMGINSLSMDASYIKEINFVLSNIHSDEWTKFSKIDPEGLGVLDRVLRLPDALAVREFLYKLISQRSHADTQLSLANIITSPRPITYRDEE
ncbi:MAG TPA: aldolase/citrate lyase family protein [Candidatus Omnitrophota bacterium]|nr:aldolase/citrate lyase family protein [Candidatus Omnitrophota bacterium]